MDIYEMESIKRKVSLISNHLETSLETHFINKL